MKLTENKIEALYRKLKLRAGNSFSEGDYEKSLKYWELASHTAYHFYLCYRDEEIEEGLLKIAKKIRTKDLLEVAPQRCVFYDAHSVARGGLTQQYIRSIIAAGGEMVYITESVPQKEKFLPILQELQQAKGVKIEYIPQHLQGLDRIQYIYDVIIGANADKLFMHILPASVCAVAAIDALPKSIEKFQINFTDHAFWVGCQCLDYTLEFRQYGCNLSIAKRGIEKSKVFLMPFYPIETETPFEGFPFEKDGKIVVFSGGAYYKVIDEEDSYFKLSKTLISIDERIVIAYAGYGDENLMRNKLAEYGISDRFYLLGFRKDISAIYENCDIYLDTAPHTGGLMCQYAARHSVPILSYNGWKVEDLVCQVGWVPISSNSDEEFVQRATRLVNDIDYRKEEGLKASGTCVSVSQFNAAFVKTIKNKRTQFVFQIQNPFVELDCDRQAKLLFENNTKSFQRSFVKRYGIIRTLLEFPSFVFSSIIIIVKENRLLTVLKKII